MKSKTIDNLDALDKEIYRLKLEAKNLEQNLEDNFGHLRNNYFSMFVHSFGHSKKQTGEERHSVFDSLLQNERLTTAINKVADHIAGKAAEEIENLAEKIFHNKK